MKLMKDCGKLESKYVSLPLIYMWPGAGCEENSQRSWNIY